MSKTAKNIITVVVIAALVLSSALAGSLLNGKSHFALSLLGFANSSQEPEKPDESGGDETAVPPPVARPDKLTSLVIDAGRLGLSGMSSSEQLESELTAAVTFAADNGFNALTVSALDSENLPVKATVDGKESDVLAQLLKIADEANLYTAVEFGCEGYSEQKLEALFDGYDFDCLFLSGTQSHKSAVKLAADKARELKPAICIAVETCADEAQELSELLSSRHGDFFVSLPESRDQADGSYSAQLEALNTFLRGGADFAASLRLDWVDNAQDFRAATAIIDAIELCAELDSCFGSVMFDYSELSSDEAIGAIVLKYMSDKNRDELEREFALKNFSGTAKTINESKITFSGSSSPLYPLTLNSKEVEREANGDFSFEVDLEVGANELVFEHKGEKHSYTVVYEVKILDSVSPTGEVNAPGGSALTVSATALKGSSVYAVINGSRVNMTRLSNVVQDENGTVIDESSDFAVFSGKYTLPPGTITEQSLGKITVHASYNGISASLTGAAVSVSAELPLPDPQPQPQPSESAPSTGETTGSGDNQSSSAQGSQTGSFDPASMLTPYKYAGVSGTSKMCEIVSLCETMPADVLDDCVPYSSPLPAGTFDYISSEYTYDGVKYYRLASGKNILASKAKLISSGYNLPQNKVTVVSSTSDSEETKIKLGLLWKGPFNISVKNQSYLPQAQANGGSLYAVSSFNGKYLDLVFYHAGTVSGKVNVSGSRIVSAAEWISDASAKTLTLRLTLKTAGKFYGFDIDYTSDGCLTLAIKAKPATELKGSVIMLDAGHGGNDSGAICAYNPDSSRKYEKQLNLQIAQKIKSKLEAQGATVIMTRNSDVYLTLDERVSLARSKNPDMFIAVHCDSNSSATPMGTSAYYYQAYSFPLASAVHKRLVSTYNSDIYANAEASVKKRIDRGTNMYPFRVTRVEECPAVLIEYGFVSNINECKLLWTNSVQEKLAQATVDGIRDYISSS